MRRALGVLVALAACGGRAAAPTPASAPRAVPTAAPRPVRPPVAPAAPVTPVTASEVAADEQAPVAMSVTTDRRYAALPADATVVMAIDLARLRASPHFAARYEHDLREWFGDLLGELTTDCQIDPLTAIDHILIGARDVTMADRVVVIRGLAPEVVARCLEQVVAAGRPHGDPRRVARFAAGLELTAPGAPPVRIGFFDERTLILVRHGAASASRDDLARAIAAEVGGGATANPALVRVIDHARAASVAWFAGERDVRAPGVGARGEFVVITLAAGAQLEGRFALFGTDPDSAALARAEVAVGAILRDAAGDPDVALTVRAERIPGAVVVHFALPAVTFASLIERAGQGKLSP